MVKSSHKNGFVNGLGGLFRNVIFKLIVLSPIVVIVFIAYGDRFLPNPFNNWSLNARNQVNSILKNSFDSDLIKNERYNNKKSDQLIDDMEQKSRER